MELVAALLAFPTVVFSGLLTLALMYWLFVVLGAVDIDAFGGATDGALEGATKGVLEGATKGVLEGATKGVLEGATKGVLEGAADHLGGAADGLDLDMDGDAGHPHEPAMGMSPSMLKLGSAPVTVVYSLFSLFGWMLSSLYVLTFGHPGVLGGVGIMLGSSVVGLLLTSIAIRPLAPIFKTRVAARSKDVVGQIATISTGKVTPKFGQALLPDGGAGLILEVRAEAGNKLKRGDRAVLIHYDAENHLYEVEKLPSHDDVRSEPPPDADASLTADAPGEPEKERRA